MRRRDVLRAGGVALAAASTGVTTPTPTETAELDFEPLGRLDLPGAKELVVNDDIAYVATTDGFATVDTSNPADPTLLARVDGLLAEHPDGPLEMVFDGKVGGDYYALGAPGHPQSNVPYAALVFDVSDPAKPERVLAHETEFYHHNVDADGETLYLCANDGARNPLICVDIASGEELGRWSVIDADDRWADVHHSLREIHDVRVEDGVAYCANWNAGTWLVDVSDPADPTAVVGLHGLDPEQQAEIPSGDERRQARFGLPGNNHFAMPQRGVDSSLVALNEEAWAFEADAPESDLGGVELWDADRETRLARIEAPPTRDATYGGVWTTAHNFAFVGDRLYSSWYRGGVKVHDVSDPTAPEEVAHWRDTARTNFWTAQPGSDHVVASSWRDESQERPEEGAAVYTFPDGERPTPMKTEGDGTGFGLAAGAAGFGAAALARRLRNRR
ncbi:MAG: hypothetical protein ACI8UR_001255 [Natronomonas sp.]|jgi:hypothetical protein|uniref:LVIVD repeat-containing protein n=1 Tax=Natronomonas sp. TaxID=2184060 RepID=UPI0039E2A08E